MTLTKQKTARLSTNQRKRLGQHHSHGRHYIKTYWPYLPIFAVLLVGILVNNGLNHQHQDVLGYSTDINAKVLLEETNGIRVSYHEPALQLNQRLTAAAQAKANDMVKQNFWSHVTPSGEQPWGFITAAGYKYEAAGENLAYGFNTSDQIITAWMDSADHRANILDEDYQDVGFATANSPNFQGTGPETIVVAEYAEPVGMINVETNSTASKPEVLGTQTKQITRLQILDPTNAAEIVIAAIAGASIAIFFARHAWAWHRVLVKSEEFFIGHPFFDVFLVSLAVFCFLMTHVAGMVL
jgi:uncharacterized protein YkwD